MNHYRTQRSSNYTLYDGVQLFCHDDPVQRDQREEDPWPEERVQGILQQLDLLHYLDRYLPLSDPHHPVRRGRFLNDETQR